MKTQPVQKQKSAIEVMNMAQDYEGKRRLAWKKILEHGRLDDDGLLNFFCPFHVIFGEGAISNVSCKCIFRPAIERFETDCGEKGPLMQLAEALIKTGKAETERRIEMQKKSMPSRLAKSRLDETSRSLP